MYDLHNNNVPIHLSRVHIQYENIYKLRNKAS